MNAQFKIPEWAEGSPGPMPPMPPRSLGSQIVEIMRDEVIHLAHSRGADYAVLYRDGLSVHASLIGYEFRVDVGGCAECEECAGPHNAVASILKFIESFIDLPDARAAHLQAQTAGLTAEYYGMLCDLGAPKLAVEFEPATIIQCNAGIIVEHSDAAFARFLARRLTPDIQCCSAGFDAKLRKWYHTI